MIRSYEDPDDIGGVVQATNVRPSQSQATVPPRSRPTTNFIISHRASVSCIVLLSLAWYLANHAWAQPASDTVGLTYIPFAILRGPTFFLDAYKPLVGTIISHGHVVSKSPIGTPLTVLPFYVPYALFGHHVTPGVAAAAGKMSGTALTTAGNVIFYFALVRLRVRHWIALGGALLLGLGTETASIASQGMWQQSGEAFWLAVLLLAAAIIWQGSPRVTPYILLGFSGGMIAVSRVQDVVISCPLMVVALIHAYRRHNPVSLPRRKVLLVGAGLAPCVLFQAVYNLVVFQALLATGYAHDNSGGALASFDGPLLSGLQGMLIGPAKGWLVYTPWVIAALVLLVVSVIRAMRSPHPRPMAMSLALSGALICLPYTVMLGKYFRWPGGYTFGPRYELDLDPILVLILGWSLDSILPALTAFRAILGKALFVLLTPLLLWSTFLQYLGLFVPYGFTWNHVATTADLYSWSRSQLLYYLRSFVATLPGSSATPIKADIAISGVYFTSATNPLGNSDPNAPRVTCFAPRQFYWGFLTVHNLGPDTLTAFPDSSGLGNFLISYHLIKGQRMLLYNGETATLLSDLAPNARESVEIQIRTPDVPGRYKYVFTGLQLGFRWFQPGFSPHNAQIVPITVLRTCTA